MRGVYYTIHRPSLGEAKEIDIAHAIAERLACNGEMEQAVHFLRIEYPRIWNKWKECVSESIEEYK